MKEDQWNQNPDRSRLSVSGDFRINSYLTSSSLTGVALSNNKYYIISKFQTYFVQ